MAFTLYLKLYYVFVDVHLKIFAAFNGFWLMLDNRNFCKNLSVPHITISNILNIIAFPSVDFIKRIKFIGIKVQVVLFPLTFTSISRSY